MAAPGVLRWHRKATLTRKTAVALDDEGRREAVEADGRVSFCAANANLECDILAQIDKVAKWPGHSRSDN
jgi:hypothetical protein